MVKIILCVEMQTTQGGHPAGGPGRLPAIREAPRAGGVLPGGPPAAVRPGPRRLAAGPGGVGGRHAGPGGPPDGRGGEPAGATAGRVCCAGERGQLHRLANCLASSGWQRLVRCAVVALVGQLVCLVLSTGGTGFAGT